MRVAGICYFAVAVQKGQWLIVTKNTRHSRIVQIVEFNVAPNEACQPGF